MILYHGSNTDIQHIDFAMSKPNKDFGRGFYLTADRHQAQQLAEQRAIFGGGKPTINTYLFDENALQDKNFKVNIFEEYSEEWAEFVIANRSNSTKKAIHDYDLIYGPIADDKVGVQIELFTDKLIDMQTLILRLKYSQGITFQYFFGTEKAISLLQKI